MRYVRKIHGYEGAGRRDGQRNPVPPNTVTVQSFIAAMT